MHPNSISRCLAGAFYLIVSLVPGLAPARAVDAGTDTHSLELDLRLAYDDPAREDQFDLIDQLKAVYRVEHRPQELAWLEARFGNPRIAAQIEKELRLQLATEPIVDSKPLSFGVSLVTLRNGGRAVLRSRESAIPGFRLEGLREATHDSRIYDVVVYQISHELEFDLVAVTTRREDQGRLSTIQAYVPHARSAKDDYRITPYRDERMRVLDYLTIQMDRHAENHGSRAGGYPVAWDNGAVFDSPLAVRLRQEYAATARPLPMSSIMPTQISPTVLRSSKAFRGRLAEDPNYIKYFGYAEAMDLFQRLDRLIKANDCVTDIL